MAAESYLLTGSMQLNGSFAEENVFSATMPSTASTVIISTVIALIRVHAVDTKTPGAQVRRITCKIMPKKLYVTGLRSSAS